jgi:hypothetical protein
MIKRMPKFITIDCKVYKVKRHSRDCYALYHDDGFFSDEFWGYASKTDIERALERDNWY